MCSDCDLTPQQRIEKQIRNGGPARNELVVDVLMRMSWIGRLSRKYGKSYLWPKNPAKRHWTKQGFRQVVAAKPEG